MHIFIKNKKLTIGHYKVKCAVGKRGIGTKKREGDQITPKGKFKIKSIFFRKDRVSNLKSKLSKKVINKNMGWCDDPRSKKYNKLIRYPFAFSSEKLYKKDNTYDIILSLSFNSQPTIAFKGSAIFIHIAKKNFRSTSGCIAVSKKHLKKIVALVTKKTIVNIS